MEGILTTLFVFVMLRFAFPHQGSPDEDQSESDQALAWTMMTTALCGLN